MDKMHTTSLTKFCATLCSAMETEPPQLAEAAEQEMTERLRAVCGGTPERVLLHNADAMAAWLLPELPQLWARVTGRCPVGLKFRTVMPSVTPVCFGTMYTGAAPQVHGIVKYERPVIRIDSLFDALPRAGKKAAIVAVEDSSMAIIFAGRPVEYYIEKDDQAVKRRALSLLAEDRYDFLAVYTQDYDSTMHKYGVLAPQAVEAFSEQTAIFAELWDAAAKAWAGRRGLMGLCTDHGVHQIAGVGAHGSDDIQDLNIIHYFGNPCAGGAEG